MITKFVDVDGVSTRCMVAGEEGAPPLILVHGLSLTSEIWLRNIDVLAQDFRVVAVDMLGHGFTRPLPGKENVGIGDKVAHLARLADVLGFETFAYCGSSYGGLIGANLYLSQPDRLSKLVIAGSGSSFNTEAQLSAFMERIYANYKPSLTVSTPEMWLQRMKSTFHDAAAIPRELGVVLPLCYAQPWMETSWESTIQTMRDPTRFRPYRVLERLEDIAVETLIVWGLQDPGGIYESAVAASKRMPHATLIAYDRCGHMPMLECPEQFNTDLRGFLMGR